MPKFLKEGHPHQTSKIIAGMKDWKPRGDGVASNKLKKSKRKSDNVDLFAYLFPRGLPKENSMAPEGSIPKNPLIAPS
jgi:hypothetical protein